MRKHTPYNTGKVLIGVNHTPKPDLPTDQPSEDMAKVQKALLSKPTRTSTLTPTSLEAWMLCGAAVFSTIIIVLDLFIWRP